MAFDKELAILHGCFQFKSFQKNYPSRKKPHWGQKFLFFFFLNLSFESYIKMHIIVVHTCQTLCIKPI